MANKIALLLLGGIVLTAVGAGAAIGLHLSGGGGGDTTPSPAADGGSDTGSTATTAGNATTTNATTTNATADGGGTTPTATATPSPTVAPTPTATATATPTPEPLPRTPTPAPTDSPTATATPTSTATSTPRPVSPDEFDEARIEELVVERINDRRADRGLEKLFVRDGMPEMARNHSRRMSEQGYPSHAAGGFNTEDRYRRNDFYRGCKIVDDTETDTRSGAAIETVDKVSAGQEFDGRYNRNESQVAEDAVSNWFKKDSERRKLLYENAGSLGVGVHVSGSGHAYVTVDLCS